MHTDDIRKPNAQQEKRKESRSKYKNDKHASHTMSLELVKHIQGTTPGPPALDKLREIFNRRENYRMVLINTNLKEHKKIDATLIAKSKNNTELTVKEKQRATLQLKILRKNEEDLPPGFRKKAFLFYESLGVE
eukprot:gb/GECH01000313.1/.p1 GENE.gb/GECH01000313.1/~~gb/GECH01000313.1/.p1  ORF type:complete len:134 (+),score=19.77 gb/GECH01000313.1/:1-402(+)